MTVAEAEESTTVCRILNGKNLLTDVEYKFETQQVAVSYSNMVFAGYLFILQPVIWCLCRFQFLDKLMILLVHQWMAVHHQKFSKTQDIPWVLVSLSNFCVAFAEWTGQLLAKLGHTPFPHRPNR